jgi:ribosomal protein S18 acetylase RimI-like enzyme
MGGAETGQGRSPEIAANVENFLIYARDAKLDLLRQVQGVDAQGRMIAMCMWVPSAGKTALLFSPAVKGDGEATSGCAREALIDAKSAGVLLVQVMLEPGDALGQKAFSDAGLWQLAHLQYMERKPPMLVPNVTLPEGITLEPYSAATHEAFKLAIQESYIETQDCPGLSGLRDMEDVIAGHKAVGPFDPQLWSLVMERSEAIGVLLLADVPARNALELVYLGLSPRARGRGLGRMLMNRVLSIASRRSFAVTTLAVDANNLAAAKLYRRCGYTRVGERVALIKKL